MHWIQTLIGPLEVLAEVRAELPSAVLCPLCQGLALIPVTEALEVQLQGRAQGRLSAVRPFSGELACGVAELAAQLSDRGPIVYAATYFHGGTGGQDAVVWLEGEVVLNIGDEEDDMSPWPDSPISRALRRIGVVAKVGEDEFDALGLGRHRSNQAWADAQSA
ncbi:hypothetical protein [Pseudomonas sp. 910_21]|uniref:hypothetical protein n=1 Tax=Pseudomonas sp. 910_21 TaxID=2604460 RepID=UPI00406417E3